MLAKNGSDLHFIAGDPPRVRLYGELHNLRPEILTPQFVDETLKEIMPRARSRGSKRSTAPTSPTSFRACRASA